MNKRIKDVTIGFLVGCTVMMTTPVMADTILQKIDVVLNTVKVEVDGEKLNADNILYNGTTYLPMRAVAEAVNKEVQWNQTTMTASIKDKTEEMNNVGDITFTEEEYQNFVNKFYDEGIIYQDDSKTINIKCYIYNGNLTRDELRRSLNIKNLVNRNEILTRLIDEKYKNEDTNKNFTIQFWYRNNDENYLLGAIAKKIDGSYKLYFENCDMLIK